MFTFVKASQRLFVTFYSNINCGCTIYLVCKVLFKNFSQWEFSRIRIKWAKYIFFFSVVYWAFLHFEEVARLIGINIVRTNCNFDIYCELHTFLMCFVYLSRQHILVVSFTFLLTLYVLYRYVLKYLPTYELFALFIKT